MRNWCEVSRIPRSAWSPTARKKAKGNELVRAATPLLKASGLELLRKRRRQGGHRRQGGCGRHRWFRRQCDAQDLRSRCQADRGQDQDQHQERWPAGDAWRRAGSPGPVGHQEAARSERVWRGDSSGCQRPGADRPWSIGCAGHQECRSGWPRTRRRATCSANCGPRSRSSLKASRISACTAA